MSETVGELVSPGKFPGPASTIWLSTAGAVGPTASNKAMKSMTPMVKNLLPLLILLTLRMPTLLC